MNKENLKIKKAEINFVYSCIPAVNGVNISFKNLFGEYSETERQKRDVLQFEGFSFSEKERELQKVGVHKVNQKIIENLKKFDSIKFKRYRPHCRKGISQYLSLDLDMGFIMPDLRIENCKLQYNERKYTNNKVFSSYKIAKNKEISGFDKDTTDPNDDFSFEIKPIIRIFPNGVSCTLKVIGTSINDDFFYENEVYKVLHLIGLNQNCAPNYLIEFNKDDFKYDYDIFENSDMSRKYFELNGGVIRLTLFNLFKLLIKKLIQEPLSVRFSSDNASVNLLCGKHLIKPSLNDQSSIFEQKETQSPWVVSNLELEESCFKEFSSTHLDDSGKILGTKKSETLKSFQKAITPLLFRTPDLNLSDFSFDSSYYHYSEWESDYLPVYSIHFDDRQFVQMSRRSLLTLTGGDGISDKYPGKYFVPGLLDISEMVRVRWQTLVLLNYLSDKQIRSIKNGDFFEINQELGDKNSTGLDSIINQIYQLSTCLDSPSSYVVSGDALREIQERLVDTFRLPELTKVVLKKSDIIESLRNLSIKRKALKVVF